MPCDKYDISNLTITQGKSVEYYFEANEEGGTVLGDYDKIFPNSSLIEARKVPEQLRIISNEGGTPISRFISAGHGGRAGNTNGVYTEYSVRDILAKATATPSYERAKAKKGPIRCWFTRTAQARFSGCSTSDEIAREFAKKVLRKKAVAYGTKQDIGTSYSQGKAWIYYGGYTILTDNTYDWGTEKEYFSEEAKKAVWNTHNGAL